MEILVDNSAAVLNCMVRGPGVISDVERRVVLYVNVSG
jgi:hypothetical protein